MLRLLAHDARAVELTDLHRFADPDEAAYAAWEHDTRAARTSLLIATSGRDVTALNVRARAARIEAGHVTEAGVELHDGTTAGVGDLIVTRRNQRQLTSRDGNIFV